MEVSIITNLSIEELKKLVKSGINDLLQPVKVSNTYGREILGIKEAALFLGIAIPTVYNKTCRNEIPHFKKGKKIYFYKCELKNWIWESKVKTMDEATRDAISYVTYGKKR